MKTVFFVLALVAACATAAPVRVFNILAFGAIPSDKTPAVARGNGKALFDAIGAANRSANAFGSSACAVTVDSTSTSCVEPTMARSRTLSDEMIRRKSVVADAPRYVPFTPKAVVVVPRSMAFYMLPHESFVNIQNVELRLEGSLHALTDDIALWPNNTRGRGLNFLEFDGGSNISLVGDALGPSVVERPAAEQNSVLNGHGYKWWWYVILTGHDHRPNLLQFSATTNYFMSGVLLRDSPQYHVAMWSARRALVEHVTVYVDVIAQAALFKAHAALSQISPMRMAPGEVSGQAPGAIVNAVRKVAGDTAREANRPVHPLYDAATGTFSIPTFPLNTDGIDISGTDVFVHSCNVTNFDDAYCLKPESGGPDGEIPCTKRITFVDSVVAFGVGASTGSVPPHLVHANCIADSLFDTISFHHALKMIYVKPNPASHPKSIGIIDNIKYRNIYGNMVLWWTLWVSTQQQAQPGGGANTGCSFLFPLPGTTCPTYPNTPVTNLELTNVVSPNAWLSPGILRCNPKGPCTGWRWNNVQITSLFQWPVRDNFLCQGIVNQSWVGVNKNCTSTP